MPRLTYVAEVGTEGITYLAWAAGFAQGAGNSEAADALQNILASIQLVELPDDTPQEQQLWEDEDGRWEDEGGQVIDFPAPTPEPEPEGERVPDPNFMPPPPMPGPINNQADFGAGPPPAGGVN